MSVHPDAANDTATLIKHSLHIKNSLPDPFDYFRCAETEHEMDYTILDMKDVTQRRQEEIERLVAILSLRPAHAEVLLRVGHWDVEKVIERFMEDTDACLASCGLPLQYEAPAQIITRVRSSLLADGHASFNCMICLEEIPLHPNPNQDEVEFACLFCRHMACLSCYRSYVEEKIIYQGESRSLLCPSHNCKLQLTSDWISFLCAPEVYQKHEYYQLRNFVDDHPIWQWCPSPTCNLIVSCSLPSRLKNRIVPVVRCQRCQQHFCFGCKEGDHRPIPCHLLKLWLQKCNDDSETSNWLVANTKECPKCHSIIEKNGGCNHMTCRSCKYEFCWVCSGIWFDHGQNYYKCNVYTESSDEPATDTNAVPGPTRSSDSHSASSSPPSSKKSSPGAKASLSLSQTNRLKRLEASKARQALERYLHYQSRYVNHEQSAKLETPLIEKMEAAMDDIQNSTDLSWIDFDFYRRAVDILVSCRTILRFTYAFAYFLQRGLHVTDIFEGNQNDLEVAVEQLSGLLENAILSPKASFQAWRQSVLDKTSYVSSRKDILMTDVRSGLLKDRWVFSLP